MSVLSSKDNQPKKNTTIVNVATSSGHLFIVGLLVQNQKIVKIIYNIDISLLTMLLLLFVPFLSDFTIWEGSEMNLSSV